MSDQLRKLEHLHLYFQAYTEKMLKIGGVSSREG